MTVEHANRVKTQTGAVVFIVSKVDLDTPPPKKTCEYPLSKNDALKPWILVALAFVAEQVTRTQTASVFDCVRRDTNPFIKSIYLVLITVLTE